MKEYTDSELAELAAYVAGKLPEGEIPATESDPERLRAAEQLRPFYEMVRDTQALGDPGAQLATQLMRQIETDVSVPSPSGRSMGRSKVQKSQWWPRRVVLGGVAIASALVAFAILDRLPIISAPTPAVHIVTTAPGQRARLQLGDGSIVHLSVSSTLRYQADFGASERAVELDGEAYFDVAQVAGAPFVIKSGNTETQVLGTAFNVRHYDNDTAVTVAVTDGKVAVRHAAKQQPQVLTAGQILTASRNAVQTRMQTVTAPSWITGSVAFRQTPILEVLPEVERWYGVKVLLAESSLETHRVTTVIGEQPVDDVIRTLSILLGASAHRVGDTVTFSSR